MRASARPGHFGLLLGLVLLITAHLAGATHTSAFAGPHVVVEVTACFQPAADADHGLEPVPGHHHHADTHIDHAVDRPRTDVDDAVVGHSGGAADGLPDDAGAALAPPSKQGRAVAVERGVDGHGILALHCVWRL
ncbi:hypothetical protein ACFQ8O_25870 [Streptomyces coelicoflavus]|uniref:hypothetical protein n=1 Tax=Streptomyces coelicoflavus TaxID=285562 RepID=UPI0036A422F2